MDKQRGERVRITRRKTEPENTHRLTEDNSKKYLIGKILALMAYLDSDSKINFHRWDTSYRNAYMHTISRRTRMDDQRKKKTSWSRRTPQKNNPKQLQTHNVPNSYLENANGTNKKGDIWFVNMPRLVPWGIESMPRVKQRHRRELYIDQHILNERRKRRKMQAMAWIDNKKAYDMIPQS